MIIQIDTPLLLWLVFLVFGYAACGTGIYKLIRRDRIARGVK